MKIETIKKNFVFLGLLFLLFILEISCSENIEIGDEYYYQKKNNEIFNINKEYQDDYEGLIEKIIDGGENIVFEEKIDNFDKNSSKSKDNLKNNQFVVINNEKVDLYSPELLKVKLLKNLVNDGDFLFIEVYVRDKISGVQSLQVTVSSKRGHSVIGEGVYYPKKDCFLVRIKIPKNCESGEWKIERVSIFDRAYNYISYNKEHPKIKDIKFTVISPKQDITPPNLLKFSLENRETHPGEFVKFFIKVKDENKISIIEVTAKHKSSGITISSTPVYNPDKDLYEGVFFIKSDYPVGKWNIESIQLADRLYNFSNFTNINDYFFIKQSKKTDTGKKNNIPDNSNYSPIIRSIKIIPKLVKNNRNFIFLKVESKVTIDTIRAYIHSPDNQMRYTLEFRYNTSLKLWEGKLKINRFHPNGIWYINKIKVFTKNKIYDFDKNYLEKLDSIDNIEINSHLILGNFRVEKLEDLVTDSIDFIEVQGLEISPNPVKVNSPTRIFVKVFSSNTSRISNVSCTFKNINFQEKRAVLRYNSETGFFEGNVTFDRPGEWWVSGCFISDSSGNTLSIDGLALSKLLPLNISRATNKSIGKYLVVEVTGKYSNKGSFSGKNSIIGLGVYPKNIKKGERVTLFIKTKGNEIKRVLCLFQSIAAPLLYNNVDDKIKEEYIELKYNPFQKIWKGYISTEKFLPREWFLKYCQIESDNQVDIVSQRELYNLPKIFLKGDSSKGYFFIDGPLSFNKNISKEYFIEKVKVFNKKIKSKTYSKLLLKLNSINFIEKVSCYFQNFLSNKMNIYGKLVQLYYNPILQYFESSSIISSDNSDELFYLSYCKLELKNGKKLRIEIRETKELQINEYRFIFDQIIRTNNKSIEVSYKNKEENKKKIVPLLDGSFEIIPQKDIYQLGDIILFKFKIDNIENSKVSSVVIEEFDGSRYFLEYNTFDKIWEEVLYLNKRNYRFAKLWLSYGNILFYKELNFSIKLKENKIKNYLVFINSVKSSKKFVIAGDSVRWSLNLKLKDGGELYKILDYIELYLYSSDNKYYSYSQLDWNPATERWEGEASIPIIGTDGSWRVTDIVLRSKNKNVKLLIKNKELLKKFQIVVKMSQQKIDNISPIYLNSFLYPSKIDVTNYRLFMFNGSFLFWIGVKGDDNSGKPLKRCSAILLNIKDKKEISYRLLYNPILNIYDNILKVEEIGRWKLVKIILEDNAGNQREINLQ